MAYDSSLAQLNIETSDILPKEFVESLAINLVFDNIDFGKEVKKTDACHKQYYYAENHTAETDLS